MGVRRCRDGRARDRGWPQPPQFADPLAVGLGTFGSGGFSGGLGFSTLCFGSINGLVGLDDLTGSLSLTSASKFPHDFELCGNFLPDSALQVSRHRPPTSPTLPWPLGLGQVAQVGPMTRACASETSALDELWGVGLARCWAMFSYTWVS